jgi:toxin secretion/phage lysis holin
LEGYKLNDIPTLKIWLVSTLGIIGSFIVQKLGGWDTALATLVIFMGIDYLTGLIVAGVFKKSKKSETGALESIASWKGLCRKGITLLMILVAHRLDLTLGVDYIRNAVIIAYIASEAISIIENAALMGVPLPQILTNAIDLLQKNNDKKE